MKIFITGASGFVGGHATKRLVAAGHEVLAMARSDKSAARVRALGAEPVRCDLTTVEAGHLGGVDVVLHCAAYAEEYGTRAQFEEANVVGTQRMLDAAKEAGVARFIHIGTEAALFDGRPLHEIDETQPYPARQRFLYSETKAEAERRVLAAHRPGFFTLSLRPRLVWGPGDETVLKAMKRMSDEGSWVWLDQGRARTSTCYVGNLVHAIELALERGEGGQAYFITDDEDRTIKDFLTRYADAAGIALKGPSLPGALVRPVGRFVEGLWRALGLRKTPPVTGLAVAFMSTEVTVRIDKAKAGLGYAPVVPVDQGMATLQGLIDVEVGPRLAAVA